MTPSERIEQVMEVLARQPYSIALIYCSRTNADYFLSLDKILKFFAKGLIRIF